MTAKRIFGLLLAALLCWSTLTQGAATTHEAGFEKNKARLLSYILTQELQHNYFSHKAMDDDLSREAFSLYLKQIDPRKQFYLQKDIDELSQFSTKLDDEMRNGQVIFPLVAEEMLKARVATVQHFLDDFEKRDLDLNKKEFLESDDKKIKYCQTEDELKDRWEKTIKYQIVSQYLNRDAANEAKKDIPDKEKEPPKSEQELIKEAKEKVLKTSRELLERIMKREAKDEYDRFFTIVARSYDPHTDYMPPTEKEDFDIHMRGSLEGIGAELQEEDGFIKVRRIIPGGAAAREKQLTAHDVILMVAQGKGTPVDITDMRINDAVRLIRGPKGSEVRLTVKKPDGHTVVIPIIRDVVQLDETFVKSTLLEGQNHERYGYIKIPTFYRDFEDNGHAQEGRNVTDDVKKALAGINKTKTQGLIIDLRNNGGGALVDAVKIAGLFIKTGPVVQIKSSDNKAEVLYDYDPDVYYSGPLLVLVNRFSASASEILAAALQDYHRALIVGSDHTYGKGTVQTVINLDNELPLMGFDMDQYKPLGALKITTQKFYRISGGSTQDKGVIPDVVLPDAFAGSKIGERYDENALPWDTIAPAPYERWQSFPFDLRQIDADSQKRVQANKKFVEIEKEAEEGKDRMAHTLIPIDLASVKQERDRTSALRKEEAKLGHAFGMDDDENAPDHVLTPQEESKRLAKNLKDDPYVQESLAILNETGEAKAPPAGIMEAGTTPAVR